MREGRGEGGRRVAEGERRVGRACVLCTAVAPPERSPATRSPAVGRVTCPTDRLSSLFSNTSYVGSFVKLWRVVVPRGGPEPPPPPPVHPHHHHTPADLWGYGPPPPPPPPHWPPPLPPVPPTQQTTTTSHQSQQQSRGYKRSHSDSEDQDDVFSEESSKEQCSSPGDADSCQMLSRKKRRGIIEKRRRDRINTSLLELRRLVPSAFEKQGSAKLEKAEILQMTVDHLKTLHSKGGGEHQTPYDPSKLAMDYHSLGFRECAAEVARYLVTVEGLDLQDPLRLRLMSHLQCFAAQRELTGSKPSAGGASWESGGAPQQPPSGASTPSNNNKAWNNENNNSGSKNWTDTSGTTTSSSANSSFECDGGGGGGPTLTPLTPAASGPPSYPGHYLPPQGYLHDYPPTSSHQKPYRPWGGTELAY